MGQLLLVNAAIHDPYIGYDAGDHIRYIEVLSTLRLPGPSDTREFFSAPLAYALPALVKWTRALSFYDTLKLAQLLNVLYAVGVAVFMVRICRHTAPADSRRPTLALAVLAIMPVWYKSLAFVRPEPLLALLTVLIVWQAVRFVDAAVPTRRQTVVLGVILGLAPLARQWGLLVLGGVAIFLVAAIARRRDRRWLLIGRVAGAFAIAAVVGGWFYYSLYARFGSARAFNMKPKPSFSLANQPKEFYLSLGLDRLFRDPIRRSFQNQAMPIFYSDFWGDYYCYFLVAGRRTTDGARLWGPFLEPARRDAPLGSNVESNRYTINGYLGRVNLVSLVPSALLLAATLGGLGALGLFVARGGSDETLRLSALIGAIALATIIGYLWFLIMYPTPGKGDTVKAAYMLHLYPLVALQAADLLLRIRRRSVRAYRAALVVLVCVALHNLPTCLTRYGL
jgi:hypothetical protein